MPVLQRLVKEWGPWGGLIPCDFGERVLCNPGKSPPERMPDKGLNELVQPIVPKIYQSTPITWKLIWEVDFLCHLSVPQLAPWNAITECDVCVNAFRTSGNQLFLSGFTTDSASAARRDERRNWLDFAFSKWAIWCMPCFPGLASSFKLYS